MWRNVGAQRVLLTQPGFTKELLSKLKVINSRSHIDLPLFSREMRQRKLRAFLFESLSNLFGTFFFFNVVVPVIPKPSRC